MYVRFILFGALLILHHLTHLGHAFQMENIHACGKWFQRCIPSDCLHFSRPFKSYIRKCVMQRPVECYSCVLPKQASPADMRLPLNSSCRYYYASKKEQQPVFTKEKQNKTANIYERVGSVNVSTLFIKSLEWCMAWLRALTACFQSLRSPSSHSMQYVTKALSSFSEFYRDLNPATLSGAIDVVVIQNDDRLSCSPFHVRFGKLQILRPQDKIVDVYVNGELTELKMKLGDAGEAFFVCEVEGEDVKEEYMTSPILRPEDVDGGMSGEVEHMKLDDVGQLEARKVVTDSEDERHTLEDGGYAGFYSARGSDFEVEVMSKPMTPAIPEESMDTTPPSTAAQRDVPLPPIDEVSPSREDRDETNRTSPLSGSSATLPGSEAQGQPVPRFIRGRTLSDLQEFNDDVYDHYGATSDSELDPRYHAKPRHAATDPPILHRDEIPFIPGPKSDTELDAAYHGTVQGNEWSWGWGSLPRKGVDIHDAAYANMTADASTGIVDDGNEWIDPVLLAEKQHLEAEKLKEANKEIELGPVIHIGDNAVGIRLAMSLCGIPAVEIVDKLEARRVFRESAVSYEAFNADPSILVNPKLVVFDGSKYYPWAMFVPLVAAHALFGKGLEESTIQKLEEQHRPKPAQVTTVGRKSRWRWWSRSDVTAVENINPSSELPTVEARAEMILESKSADISPPVSRKSDHATVDPILSAQNNPNMDHSSTTETKKHIYYVKSLRLTSEQLMSLNLKSGSNTVTFRLSATNAKAYCTAKIFLWPGDAKVVISDIDGTITRSDALGHIFTMVGKDWTHHGVAKLYTDIVNNGYRIMYLTSRAIGQADATRGYLKNVQQGVYQLPEGPVIMSPDRLFTSFHREVILRRPEIFKMSCLRDIAKLFDSGRPFYAGFGNRITDAMSYRSVDVPTSRIFTIDYNGDVRLELTDGFKSSYPSLQELVDHIFPLINQKTDESFNDFNYWKQPLPKIDLPMPNSPSRTPMSSPPPPPPPKSPSSGGFSMFSFRGRISPIPDLEQGFAAGESARADGADGVDVESDVDNGSDVGLADYAAELDDLAASIDFSEHPF